MSEPILHLAKRAVKQPETLRASEIKSLAEWVILAYRQREREVGVINHPTDFTIEGNHVLGIGRPQNPA